MKKKSDSSQRDLVGGIMNDLLVNTSHYITTGVPPHVLVSRLSHELTVNAGESNAEKFHKKAKELIEAEVKNETLVRFPSGNYLHGPRKTDGGQSAPSGEESDSVAMSAEEEDEDEDDDEEEEENDRRGKKDSDYSPNYVPRNFTKKTLKRGEGRTSGRMKKSRFDSDEYVFPTIVKNLNKRSPIAAQEKPRRRPGPKPKKKCPLCSMYSSTADPLTATCKSCTVNAHMSCVERDMTSKGKDASSWVCCYCKPVSKKWRCVICEETAGKDNMGILVSCDSCNLKYHKSCHSPPIQVKHIKNWKCVRCAHKPISRAKDAVENAANSEESDDESSNLDFTLRCYICHNKFYNPANKLKCAECKYLFHTRCCRVRTAENALRLGSKRHKWKCDHCILGPSGLKQADSCRVVIPRLQLKTEPKSESSDESGSVSCKTSRRQLKKRGRYSEKKSSAVCDDLKLEVKNDEEEELKEEKEKNKVLSIKRKESDQAKREWWSGRLKPITVGKNQPSLGPIPDFSVPDVTHWSSSEVESYFNEYFLDKSVGRIFVDQDIDGKALKLMRRNDILKMFDFAGFKLDIIMDVMQHIKRLQLRVNDRRYIWADIF